MLGADHPRIRGEHQPSPVIEQILGGSSPHTRGARSGAAAEHDPRRIIPAYAGSTISESSQPPEAADHPRIRGEHHVIGQDGRERLGSSPHTRGAHGDDRLTDQLDGIIPAYAGSTRTLPSCSGWRPDHPRIRGEHAKQALNTVYGKGSSPHTRGALDRGCRCPSGRRIIPAYAGSTDSLGRRRGARPDHPRIRGEHHGRTLREPVGEGSSPHTRGAPHFPFPPKSYKRIIPAYAGSTEGMNARAPLTSDHPRIRGEHGAVRQPLEAGSGSSPHTRGAPSQLLDSGRQLGIIPAYAGSTCAGPRRRVAHQDHPRIRGEHLAARFRRSR